MCQNTEFWFICSHSCLAAAAVKVPELVSAMAFSMTNSSRSTLRARNRRASWLIAALSSVSPAARDISSSRTKSSANTTSSSQPSERYATPSTSTSSHTDCSTDIWSARDRDKKPAGESTKKGTHLNGGWWVYWYQVPNNGLDILTSFIWE